MDKQILIDKWLHEQEIAYIKGWDFSHIRNRYTEEDDLPWNFGNIINKYLRETDHLLDMETGGGEFLLTLNQQMEEMRFLLMMNISMLLLIDMGNMR